MVVEASGIVTVLLSLAAIVALEVETEPLSSVTGQSVVYCVNVTPLTIEVVIMLVSLAIKTVVLFLTYASIATDMVVSGCLDVEDELVVKKSIGSTAELAVLEELETTEELETEDKIDATDELEMTEEELGAMEEDELRVNDLASTS